MALEEYCAACTYLGEAADTYGLYFCERKGDRLGANTPKCYNFCEAYSRGNYARENMYQNSVSHQTSGCYLTTIMCEILGYPDNNYYLQMLRTFRDTVLKQDMKYFSLLVTYDTIGPQIATELKKDENRIVIARTLFTRYIVPSVNAIEEGKTQEAINIYTCLTQSLGERYNINTHIIIPDPNQIDKETLGHARIRRKKLETC